MQRTLAFATSPAEIVQIAAKLDAFERYMHDCGLYSIEDMRPINETRMVARWKLGAALKHRRLNCLLNSVSAPDVLIVDAKRQREEFSSRSFRRHLIDLIKKLRKQPTVLENTPLTQTGSLINVRCAHDVAVGLKRCL